MNWYFTKFIRKYRLIYVRVLILYYFITCSIFSVYSYISYITVYSYISYKNNFYLPSPFSNYLYLTFMSSGSHFSTLFWLSSSLFCGSVLPGINALLSTYLERFLNIYIVNLINDPMYFKRKTFIVRCCFVIQKKLFFILSFLHRHVTTIIYLSSYVFNELIYINPITYSRWIALEKSDFFFHKLSQKPTPDIRFIWYILVQNYNFKFDS